MTAPGASVGGARKLNSFGGVVSSDRRNEDHSNGVSYVVSSCSEGSGSPADVAVLGSGKVESGSGVFVPFGGGEHDWAALELGASLASATGDSLFLVGTKADAPGGRRDASRLLADASLAAQRVVGVETRPLLAEPTEDALLHAVDEAGLVVAGISPRWRREGIGSTRRGLVRRALPPVLLVHRGPRPSGLAPRESRTRFTWTLDA